MHHKALCLASIAALLCFQSVSAETLNERDFKQARVDRDKAAAAALEPINRRYKDILEKLFKNATQAAELDLAREIQAELQAVGGASAAKAAGATVAAPTTSSAPTDKTDLRKLIENSEWNTWMNLNGRGEPSGRVIFHRDGKATWSGGRQVNYYLIEAPDVVKLFGSDPKRDRKATFFLMHVNMDEKTATKDESLSTGSADIFLKYDGPAKLAK